MHSKLVVFLAGMVILSESVFSMEPDTRMVTTTHRSMMGPSSISLNDDYLSAETYEGFGLQLNHSSARYLSNRNTHLIIQQDMDALLATTQNRAGTATISHTSLHYGYGILFPLRPFCGIKAAIGPMAGADCAVRMQSRNVNNPTNVDLMGDLQLAGNLTYDVTLFAKNFRLKAQLRAPLLGIQFAPVKGISYYEMLSFGQLGQALHITSFQNKNAWTGQYTVDVPFKALTLSLGVMHRYSLFKTNEVLLRQNNWSFMAGCTFDVLLLSGAARQNPTFLSIDR